MLKDSFSGLSHLAGGVLALAGGAWLVVRTTPNAGAIACTCVYGACLVALFAASSMYHLVVASQRTTRVLRLIDHMAIFVMVAGTCTPLFYRAFSGPACAWVLAAIWSAAAAGIVFKLVWRNAPRALYTTIYVAMGWGAVLCGPALFHSLPSATFALVVVGGVVYTCGAVVYGLRRPSPFPTFGFHEIWHLFVLGGSALHYAAIALVV
jgi:hemolysin III